MKVVSVLFAFAATANALELTADSWDEAVAGKTVFIKFFAPWCGHCKKMKPDWDALMDEYSGNPTALVAEVDCTAAGKPLCDANGVRGYPTIKYGDPSDLQDYQGGRTLDSFKTFAAENLKPMCSPSNIDLCDDEKKAEIAKYQAMSDADLDAAIEAGSQKLADAETTFTAEVKKLQATYEQLQKDKEATIAAVKASGLGLMKSVKSSKAKAPNDEL